MPPWSPLEVGLYVGLLAAVLWSARTALKHHQIAGFYMVVESRFWRSLAVGFAAAFLLVGLVATLVAALLWLLASIVTRLV